MFKFCKETGFKLDMLWLQNNNKDLSDVQLLSTNFSKLLKIVERLIRLTPFRSMLFLWSYYYGYCPPISCADLTSVKPASGLAVYQLPGLAQSAQLWREMHCSKKGEAERCTCCLIVACCLANSSRHAPHSPTVSVYSWFGSLWAHRPLGS